jgi:hypothetical protein
MKTIVRYIAVLMFCGSAGVLADTPAEKTVSAEMSSRNTSNIAARLLKDVDAVVQILDGNDVSDADQLKIALAANQIENMTASYFSSGKKWALRFDLATRSNATKEFLSLERYLALEKACVNKLKPGNENVRILAMHVLSKSLGSSAGKPYMEATLLNALKAIKDKEKMTISYEELFTVSENLAYLGNVEGLEMLKSTLGDDTCPSYLKARGIDALSYLGLTITSINAEHLFLSKDAKLAYKAFDSVDNLSGYKNTVIAAAIAQIQALKTVYTENKALSQNEQLLMMKLSRIIKTASREGTLSHDDLQKAKAVSVFFVGVDDAGIQEKAAALFAELANDDDSDLIARLFTSNSTDMREYASLAIAKCSHEAIHNQRKALIKMLDDSSKGVRNYALYALRKGLGEKTGNTFSEAEFKIQKARVLEKYKE